MGGKLWEGWELQVLRDNCGKMPIEDVAKLLPRRTVRGVHLRAFKLGLMPDKNYWTEAEDQILINNFPQLTAKEITKLLSGRTKAAVQKRIGEIGISLERWACKHSANQQFFAEPNILNCYWAGFIAADGCVSEHQHSSTKTLHISITASDGYLLERFLADTEFTGQVAIQRRKNRKLKGKWLKNKPFASVQVSCAQSWFPDLEKHFNIVPRKSLTLKPPNNLNRECSLAYIKGFIDGDGCVHIRKSGHMNIAFYGTLECLTWIKSICDEIAPHYTDEWRTKRKRLAEVIKKDKICTYSIGEYRAELLAKEILKLDIPAMKRKWDKVQNHLAEKEHEFEKLRKSVQVHIFDPSRVYLGRLCKRGHDYQGTGQTLRRVGHGSCIRCHQEAEGVEKPMIPVRYWIELTSQLCPQLKGSKFRLGELCERGHNYNSMGYSLCYISNSGCIECSRQRYQTKRDQLIER